MNRAIGYLKNKHFHDVLADKFGNDLSFTLDRLSGGAVEFYNSENSIRGIVYGCTIVAYNQNQTIFLNSDGYQTVTTKKWINHFLPYGYYLYQTKGYWYISKDNSRDPKNDIRFYDGMSL